MRNTSFSLELYTPITSATNQLITLVLLCISPQRNYCKLPSHLIIPYSYMPWKRCAICLPAVRFSLLCVLRNVFNVSRRSWGREGHAKLFWSSVKAIFFFFFISLVEKLWFSLGSLRGLSLFHFWECAQHIQMRPHYFSNWALQFTRAIFKGCVNAFHLNHIGNVVSKSTVLASRTLMTKIISTGKSLPD